MDNLRRGSSDVDWCESNYSITNVVAEFYNTISNVLFFTIPPLLIYLFRNYARWVNWQINIVWILLVVVGIGSVYFHATLSLVGQLLDEIAIIWVLMASLAIWFPGRLLPSVFKENRNKFKLLILCVAVVTSGLACIVPEVNHFVLMMFGVPAVLLLIIEVKRCSSQRIFKLGIRCGIMWVLAVACWLNDRLFCDIWTMAHFPYLHSAWHIFIFLSAYTACVLFAYFYASSETPEMMPQLKYWPRDSWDVLGIPYVHLKRTVY